MSLEPKRPRIVWRQDKVAFGARTVELLHSVQECLRAGENPYVFARAEQTCRRTGDLEALQALRTYRTIRLRA